VSTTYLLDANVLIALSVAEHVHHDRATRWAATTGRFALCPIAEGALIRFLVRLGVRAHDAQQLLKVLRTNPEVEFWADSISYGDADLTRVRGHRQTTDAYLVALAKARGGVLATLDEGLAGEHPDLSLLLPA